MSTEQFSLESSSPEEIMSMLSACNKAIKNADTREVGFSQLQGIDFDDLQEGGHKMYYRYVKGKYYSRKYKATGDVELLERANDQFDDIASIAKEHGIKPRKRQYLFMRIHTKFLLSGHVRPERKQHLLGHARFLADVALKAFPDDKSGSFQWIYEQLQAEV